MDRWLPGLSHAPNPHPFFVHFPLVLWIVALACWGIGAAGRDTTWRVGSVLLAVAVLAAVPALVTGLAAEEDLHHVAGTPMEKVHVHKNFMLATTAASGVVAVAAYVTRKRAGAGRRWLLASLLLGVSALAVLGADRGAELVYRHGVGTRPTTPEHEHP